MSTDYMKQEYAARVFTFNNIQLELYPINKTGYINMPIDEITLKEVNKILNQLSGEFTGIYTNELRQWNNEVCFRYEESI